LTPYKFKSQKGECCPSKPRANEAHGHSGRNRLFGLQVFPKFGIKVSKSIALQGFDSPGAARNLAAAGSSPVSAKKHLISYEIRCFFAEKITGQNFGRRFAPSHAPYGA